MSKHIQDEQTLEHQLVTWWSGLSDRRGERAELRRAKSVAEVIMTPSFQKLCTKLVEQLPSDFNKESVAAIVGLLSHVEERTDKKLASQMAEGNPPVVSELRFRRLLQRDRDELYVAMIRIIRMLKKQANPYDLINSVYYWGDKRKKRWAYTYFA
jgi:CRISPR system Cascade subunit CasB